MKAELDKSETLVECTAATDADLPIAKAVGDWLLGFWGLPTDAAGETGTYYARKAYISETGEPSYDFSEFTPCPHSYIDIRTERKTYLAGL